VTSGLLGRLRPLVWRPASRAGRRSSARRSARAAVAWFVAATLGLSGATLLAADVVAPAIRDPEYGRRATALQARIAEHPDRPLVLVVGSSRVGAGVCPAAWEAVAPRGRAPLLFNMGRAGAGPVVQLMTLRRVLAEGVRPAVVLLEYWPPLVNEHSPELARIPTEYLYPGDLPLVRDYWPDAIEAERQATRGRLNTIFTLRRTLLLQLDPVCVPWSGRTEMVWANLDAWGWLAGLDYPPEGCAERDRWLAKWEPGYWRQLRAFAARERSERATRDAAALAREHGAAVGLVHLPEPGEFRGWYSRKAERAIAAHLAGLSRDLGTPVIDARAWLGDGLVADGIHLSRAGAAEFTRRLGLEVAKTFPEVLR
jgi:hypothetical protein